jgi:hypothetical protein
MLKNGFIGFASILLLFGYVSNVTAYGGAGGLPIGYVENNGHKPKLDCNFDIKYLKSGMKIYIPDCKLVKSPTTNNDFARRFNYFISRLSKGPSSQ